MAKRFVFKVADCACGGVFGNNTSANYHKRRTPVCAVRSCACFCKKQQARQYAEPPHRKRIHHCNGNFAVQCVGRNCIPLHCGYDFRVESVCRSALCA